MILDRIEHMDTYAHVHVDLPKVLATLAAMDIAKLESGRYPVADSETFILIQRYTSRNRAQSVWESHRKFIDVQYVVAGEELMGYQTIDALSVSKPYDAASDAALYTGEGLMVHAGAGTVALFFPQDGHMPGVAVSTGVPILKVVAKLPVS